MVRAEYDENDALHVVLVLLALALIGIAIHLTLSTAPPSEHATDPFPQHARIRYTVVTEGLHD
ncbi:hypothetical protein [Saccharopolyspora shandongensis]|uniref:hypothetical protein n=1 Tax=Saccharopolyspora shandongensis TaxID=418495 RepID=UPI00340CD795